MIEDEEEILNKGSCASMFSMVFKVKENKFFNKRIIFKNNYFNIKKSPKIYEMKKLVYGVGMYIQSLLFLEFP